MLHEGGDLASGHLDVGDTSPAVHDYQQQWGARLRVYFRRHRTAVLLGAGLLLTVLVALILIPLVIPSSDDPNALPPSDHNR
jgi:hypothetical protein